MFNYLFTRMLTIETQFSDHYPLVIGMHTCCDRFTIYFSPAYIEPVIFYSDNFVFFNYKPRTCAFSISRNIYLRLRYSATKARALLLKVFSHIYLYPQCKCYKIKLTMTYSCPFSKDWGYWHALLVLSSFQCLRNCILTAYALYLSSVVQLNTVEKNEQRPSLSRIYKDLGQHII